ncbi:uncharacterized protein LOC143884194 [Tasmannia lanceolata]|uniref:uncharacterized protein LOC143884194 n=1 Tax=Tasmannia lanceolata TaxID=3420 RepID=UPI0040636B63
MNDLDDEDFLSQVEAAEANAKKRKADAIGKSEGSYTAALRGSRSQLWQQQTGLDSSGGRSKVIGKGSENFAAPADGDACFKCGKSGHWARDCRGGGDGEGNSEIPEKVCPCGLGNCMVLTANTEKNRGRKFYRCPVREENGGCGFFEWCDNSSGTPMARGLPNYPSNSSIPDLPCPCGAGSCLVLTAKTEKNMGQQFYRCPAKQGEGYCGFFKWCSEAGPTTGGSMVSSTWNNANSESSGGRSGSSCFKCGKEGHWARDCPKPSTDSYFNVGTRSSSSDACSASSDACYKCGKGGHWARDCSAQIAKASSANKKTSVSSRSSHHGYVCK